MLRICGSVDTNWDLTSKVNRIYVTTNVEVLLEHQVSVHMESCREIAKTGLENGKTEKHLILLISAAWSHRLPIFPQGNISRQEKELEFQLSASPVPKLVPRRAGLGSVVVEVEKNSR